MSSKLSAVFRERVRSRLNELDWSQQDFADELGVGKSYVSHLMTGRRNPGLDTLEAVAEILNVEPAWLISENVSV